MGIAKEMLLEEAEFGCVSCSEQTDRLVDCLRCGEQFRFCLSCSGDPEDPSDASVCDYCEHMTSKDD